MPNLLGENVMQIGKDLKDMKTVIRYAPLKKGSLVCEHVEQEPNHTSYTTPHETCEPMSTLISAEEDLPKRYSGKTHQWGENDETEIFDTSPVSSVQEF